MICIPAIRGGCREDAKVKKQKNRILFLCAFAPSRENIQN
jgi:hypothetical protein